MLQRGMLHDGGDHRRAVNRRIAIKTDVNRRTPSKDGRIEPPRKKQNQPIAVQTQIDFLEARPLAWNLCSTMESCGGRQPHATAT